MSNLPSCMATEIREMVDDLEARKRFVQLTEEVELASMNCEYASASVKIGQIKLIKVNEKSTQQVINDWLATNEQKLTDLKERKRKALLAIDNAQLAAEQADAFSKKDPPDWNTISPLLRNAATLLADAENTGPKCILGDQKARINRIRNLIQDIQKRKKQDMEVSIALLIDASGSMGDAGKMNKAKRAAKASAGNVSNTTEIAVLSFGGACGPGGMRVVSGFSTSSSKLSAALIIYPQEEVHLCMLPQRPLLTMFKIMGRGKNEWSSY